MELITGINRVMAYTEQHLKEDLDCAKLAQLSGCSYADFQRVFSFWNMSKREGYRRLLWKLFTAGNAYWILHWNTAMKAQMYLRQLFAEPSAVHQARPENRICSFRCFFRDPLLSLCTEIQK